MKRLFAKIPAPKLRHFTLWLDKTIEGNAGWLIAFAIVFFGLANLSFQRDNRTIIQNTQNAAEAAAQAATDTKNILAGQAKAVQDLKDDNEQQTRILCRLILRGDLDLEPDEEAEIERICQEEIDRQDTSNTQPNNTPDTASESSSENNQSTSDSNQNNNQNNDEETPRGIRRFDTIDGLLKSLGL